MSNMDGGRTLMRSRDNRMLGGVCAGLANYFGIDVNLVRVCTVLLALFTGGTGALAYLAVWALLPEEGQKTSMVEDFINKNRQG